LEKSPIIGDGGSSRNGGGVRQSGRHPAELPLAMYAIKNLWPGLSDELGTDVEYCQKGNLRLGKTKEHLDILKGLVKSNTAQNLDMRMIDYKEAREICPYLSEEVKGASWCATDGHANPMLATLAYYKAARRLGVRFITGVDVVTLRKIRGRIAQVCTADGTVYNAGQIVVAAGYESRKILSSVGIDIPMSQLLMECIVTEEAPPMFEQMLGTAMADFYGHQSKHGSFVFGGAHGFEPFATAGDVQTSSIGTSSTCRAIIGYFPALQHLKIVRTWAGWLDDCADHIPVIENALPGLTVGCAFSGHGFGISPVVGVLLAELAAGEQTTLDVSAFKHDRFKAKI